MNTKDLIYQSRCDLLEDIQIIEFLLKDYKKKIASSSKKVEIIASIYQALENLHEDAARLKKDASHIHDVQTLQVCIEKRRAIHASLHTVAGFVGQTVVSTHWQSPAADQVIVDNVGTLKGKIKATINDYTRDQHVLGNAFEELYRNALVPVTRIIPSFAYAVSSGMAAMTTAALFILGETKEGSTILLGKSCYFETKHLIHKMFGARVKEIDASDVHTVSEAIRTYAPVAIFIDILGNEPYMTVVDPQMVIRCVSHVSKGPVHIVIDISARTSLTSLVSSFIMPKNVSIIGVESLNKLFQFGLDRVTAGVVWGTGYKALRLHDYKDHAGMTCPDRTIATLPTPNAKMVSLYMKRIARNNLFIGESVLGKRVNGPYIIQFFQNASKWKYSRYVSHIMQKAKRNNIPLVHGTSFGLMTTRVYAVAMHTQYEKPFLRIAVGSETLWELERLKSIFKDRV